MSASHLSPGVSPETPLNPQSPWRDPGTKGQETDEGVMSSRQASVTLRARRLIPDARLFRLGSPTRDGVVIMNGQKVGLSGPKVWNTRASASRVGSELWDAALYAPPNRI